MSEFSESYHLRSEVREDAIALLRRAGVAGYVFPPANGWTTFVAEGGSFAPDSRLVSANQGTLLHYVSAEDHGWSFAIFEGHQPAVVYSCSWESEVEIERGCYSSELLAKSLPFLDSKAIEGLEAVLSPEGVEQVYELNPSEVFGQTVGLVNFQWLAFDYVARDIEDGGDAPEDVVKVEA